MRLSSHLLMALLPIGFAAPLEVKSSPTGPFVGRSPDGTPAPLSTPAAPAPKQPGSPGSSGTGSPQQPAAGGVTGANPLDMAPPDGSNPDSGPFGSSTNGADPTAILTGLLGTVLGTGILARDLHHLPSPLLGRMEDLFIDIRAELATRSGSTSTTKKRQLPNLPLGGTTPLSTALVSNPAAFTSLQTLNPTTLVGAVPFDKITTLVGGTDILKQLPGTVVGGINGRDDDDPNTSLEAGRLIAV